MAHPNDMRPDGTCRVCGDRLSRVIRNLTNPNCETKGEGEPISQTQRPVSGGG